MRCGISTACFFPWNTLDALDAVIATGAPVTELFLNTFSEAEPAFVSEVERRVKESGIEVGSVHPFSSMLDGFFFASRYEGRLQDGLALYRRYYEICAQLGAEKLVFHGDHKAAAQHFPLEKYVQNFIELAKLGREYGVALCHENVVYCRLGDPAEVRRLRPLLGEYAAFTLDTKQLFREGAPLGEMLDAMGRDVTHVHISDHSPQDDCIPPGDGDFDFPGLIAGLKGLGYGGDLMIELYQDGFGSAEDLVRGMQYVNELL